VDNGKGKWTWAFNNFQRSEFRCPCCGWDDIDRLVVSVLQDFRNYLNYRKYREEEYVILVTSGCRCDRHNREVKGSKNSQHKLGKAVDFVVPGFSAKEIIGLLSQLPTALALVGYVEPAGGSLTAVHIDVRKPNTQALRRWNRVGRI